MSTINLVRSTAIVEDATTTLPVIEFVTPFRDRTLELLDDQTQLSAVLEQGRRQATEVAEATLRDVWQRVGFVAPSRLPGHPGLTGG